ncbi:MAG TPA: Zn-dependent hydrolase [Bauldia sp.]|nr:Zn-dependent hydrolase [Bauldia sp.]
MSDYRRLGERAEAMINALATITAEPGKLTRLYLTPEHKRAAHLVGDWMRNIGMAVRMDAAGTMHGLLGDPKAKRLLTGSHIDTVVDAGRYDGILGVVGGILAAEEIVARGIELPFALEVLAFGDEEGVRFPKTLFGSSTVAGVAGKDMLDLVDGNGVKIGDALLAFGGDPRAIAGEAYRREQVVGYVELHIEQGPVLDQANEPLGVVSAIASQGRYRLHARGEAGHAGTVPMNIRHDALAAAAEVILYAEELGRQHGGVGAVATVGEITVSPGASNVIPGEARFSLDVRAPTDEIRTMIAADVRGRIRQTGARRGVVIGMETVHEKPVARTDSNINRAISRAIQGLIGTHPRVIMSGAGHDGQAMAQLTGIGMIFVRCRAGISHNPLESVTIPDLGIAVEALVQTIVEIGKG